MAVDHVERGLPFGMAIGAGLNSPCTIRPERFSIKAWPMKHSIAPVPGDFFFGCRL